MIQKIAKDDKRCELNDDELNIVTGGEESTSETENNLFAVSSEDGDEIAAFFTSLMEAEAYALKNGFSTKKEGF